MFALSYLALGVTGGCSQSSNGAPAPAPLEQSEVPKEGALCPKNSVANQDYSGTTCEGPGVLWRCTPAGLWEREDCEATCAAQGLPVHGCLQTATRGPPRCLCGAEPPECSFSGQGECTGVHELTLCDEQLRWSTVIDCHTYCAAQGPSKRSIGCGPVAGGSFKPYLDVCGCTLVGMPCQEGAAAYCELEDFGADPHWGTSPAKVECVDGTWRRTRCATLGDLCGDGSYESACVLGDNGTAACVCPYGG